MTSPIDPIRRAARLLRGKSADRAREAAGTEGVGGLPAPVGTAQTVPPTGEIPASAAEFDAQLMGQDGQKRGLRGGPLVIDSASASYNRVEWSGAQDRRSRKGRIAKTEI